MIAFHLFSADALIDFVLASFLAYLFCLLVISGFRLRAKSLPESDPDDEQPIKRLVNLQAAKAGLVFGLLFVAVLYLWPRLAALT